MILADNGAGSRIVVEVGEGSRQRRDPTSGAIAPLTIPPRRRRPCVGRLVSATRAAYTRFFSVVNYLFLRGEKRQGWSIFGRFAVSKLSLQRLCLEKVRSDAIGGCHGERGCHCARGFAHFVARYRNNYCTTRLPDYCPHQRQSTTASGNCYAYASKITNYTTSKIHRR